VGNRLYSFERRRICNIFQSISVPKRYTLISSTVSYCSNLMIHISIHKPRSLGVPRYTYPARPFAASIFALTSDWGSAISGGNTLTLMRLSPASSYSLRRCEHVFPKPLERSLEVEHLEMNRWFWAFGIGPFMCTESHLAILSKCPRCR
jgi:hypothetical protein